MNITCKDSGLSGTSPSCTTDKESTLILAFQETMMDPTLQDSCGRKIILPYQLTDLHVTRSLVS